MKDTTNLLLLCSNSPVAEAVSQLCTKEGFNFLCCTSEAAMELPPSTLRSLDIILLDLSPEESEQTVAMATKLQSVCSATLLFLADASQIKLCNKTTNGFSMFSTIPRDNSEAVKIAVLSALNVATNTKKLQQSIKAKSALLIEMQTKFNDLFSSMISGFALHEIICDTENHPVDYRFLDINPAFCEITGLSRKQVVGKCIRDVLPDTELIWIERYGKVALSGEPDTFEHESIALGKYFRVNVYSPRKGIFATIFEDVTRHRKDALAIQALLKEKELLLEELHHRTKNNLTAVADLVALQALEYDDDKTSSALFDVRSRIINMATVYNDMFKSKDFQSVEAQSYFTQLIKNLFKIFPNSEDVTLDLDIDEFSIDGRRIFDLSLLVNELITNAFKYVFTGPGDKLTIKIKQPAPGKLKLIIKDNGPGLPKSIIPGKTSGFGLNLVDAIISTLGGHMTIERKNGTCFTIVIE